MIVIDYSGCAIAAITAFSEDLQRDEEHVADLIRHVILSTIKTYKRKFAKEYGNEVVIACDSRHYWRKDVFPHYKASRKKQREESTIPWHLIHKYMDIVKKDLKDHFPYKVVEVYGAEADDIMAVMANTVSINNGKRNALFDDVEGEPTVIITRDKDALQLLTHEHVRVWNPYEKKYASLDESPAQFLRRLVLCGDSGDGVPNVFSPNDAFVKGIRQSPATQKKLQPMLEAKSMVDAAPSAEVAQRIKENAQLIAFNFIPRNLVNSICEAYNIAPNGSKVSIFKYLADNKMKQMMDDIEQF
jgi:5'-3' exonuclease